MLDFQRVRQQLIKLSLITLSLSLTLIALPILKQSLAFQAQAAGLAPIITSVSPDSGSVIGGDTITINADNLAAVGPAWEQISAGAYHTCALDTTGKAYCWGADWYGELGDGGDDTDQLSPVAVDSGLSFNQISVGDTHTCALDTTGQVYCWGDDSDGQLGNGADNADQFSPVEVDSSLSFSQISAGERHTCALDTTGQAYCWGRDIFGQLGDGGTFTNQPSPVAVDSSLSFSQISAEYYHTCALDTTGQAYCWGYDGDGALGDGGIISGVEHQPSPVAVDSSLSFSQISAGDYHTCALDTTGQAYCWGDDSNDQLGNGADDTDKSSPVAVDSTLSFIKISAGDFHTCALDTTSKAYCWGSDRAGQLGDGGTNTDQPSPVAVNSGLSFSQISDGTSHTCALDTTGKAYCWGDDDYGQLGDGEGDTDQFSPVAVDSSLSFGYITSLPTYLVNFGAVSSPAFNITDTSLQTIAPAHPAGPVDVFITNLDTDVTSNTLVNGYTYIGLDEPTDPTATMTPISSNLASPALTGTISDPSSDYLINIIIDGITYPAINHNDGTWSLPQGTITPDLEPGIYDVIVQVLTLTSDPVSETIIDNGLTILGTTNPNSPTSPATGYGPKATQSSISGFLIPSLVITLIGAGMLIMNKKHLSKSAK